MAPVAPQLYVALPSALVAAGISCLRLKDLTAGELAVDVHEKLAAKQSRALNLGSACRTSRRGSAFQGEAKVGLWREAAFRPGGAVPSLRWEQPHLL